MGQVMDALPQTWDDLIQERDRILQWSGEIVTKARENIQNEAILLKDHILETVNIKISEWAKHGEIQINETLSKLPKVDPECRDQIKQKAEKIKEELTERLKKDYETAYADIKKFMQKVDTFCQREINLGEEIKKIEEKCVGDAKKLQELLESLRDEVCKSTEIGKQFVDEYERLKENFTSKVRQIDERVAADSKKQFEKLASESKKCIVK